MSSQERSGVWQLPETLSGHSGVRLTSKINGQADQLTDDELTRLNVGARAAARRALGTEDPIEADWGYSFRRSEEDSDAIIFEHSGFLGQSRVEGTLIWESGDYLNAQFALTDARRVDANEA